MGGTGKFRFAIDRGGTFTDVFAECPDGSCRVLKLLSVDPANYPNAPREGIRRVLEQCTGQPHPASVPLDTSRIESIRMGTTVATNALLERKGERTALVITKGFRDLLHIGTQSRPHIFDLRVATPAQLYDEIVEVDERVVLCQEEHDPEQPGTRVFKTVTGERVAVRRPLDVDALRADLERIKAAGIRSIAVVLMHSYVYPDHERIVGQVAASVGGFRRVSGAVGRALPTPFCLPPSRSLTDSPACRDACR